MVGEAIMGLSIFKTLLDTAKGLKDMNDAAVRTTAGIELQKEIRSAQDSHSVLLQKVSDLEKEVADLKRKLADFETWEAEKQRYELKDFGGGTRVYALKPDEAGAEPVHRICPTCYEKHEKSILQPREPRPRNSFRQDVYRCPSCKNEFPFGMRQEPRVIQTKRSSKHWAS